MEVQKCLLLFHNLFLFTTVSAHNIVIAEKARRDAILDHSPDVQEVSVQLLNWHLTFCSPSQENIVIHSTKILKDKLELVH